MTIKTLIIIPARYGSTRFPGKPLTMLGDKSMLEHVYDIAKKAASSIKDCKVIIATEDQRIKEHANQFTSHVVINDKACATGTDRALQTCEQLGETPDIVVNLQGDAPLTPARFINQIVDAFDADTKAQVVTPVTQLSFAELDTLRERKKTNPFSGTTCTFNNKLQALWFSKQIIPAIRHEDSLRKTNKLSPVFQHIGLYGFRFDALKRFVNLPEGHYEQLEGLEQLRMLEQGMNVKVVKVDYRGRPKMSGVDSPKDAKIAAEYLKNNSKEAR